MGETPKRERRMPALSDRGRREAEARERRLAAALRGNLAKRKAQRRARAAGNDSTEGKRD